jgi:hypothetical protein
MSKIRHLITMTKISYTKNPRLAKIRKIFFSLLQLGDCPPWHCQDNTDAHALTDEKVSIKQY